MSFRRPRRVAHFLVFCVSLVWVVQQSTSPAFPAEKSSSFRNGVVVAVSAPGAEAGREMLQQGGTAVDAAVATAFAMAVTFPEAGNIGGGGFMLVVPGKGQPPVLIDYRETAPASTHRTTYVEVASKLGHKAVGTPGTVRGLALAHQKFGKLPWKQVVLPAVKLAEEGFAVNDPLAKGLNGIVSSSKDFPELKRVLGKPDGTPWKAGDVLRQPELGATLRLIAEQGPDAFYTGKIADQIVAEMQAGGGFVAKTDLAQYRAVVREPMHGTYKGHDIITTPAPAGGLILVEMLNILENFDLKANGRDSAATLHLMTEAMRRAYADRARHEGDPDFTTIPAHLTQKEYARKLAAEIDRTRATPSEKVAPEIELARGSDSTTHFSVIDRDGMAVANTYTLEFSYGSRVVVRGAGFLLNNEMGDFNWRPGHTDRTGNIGTRANEVAPGKRMLSSQTPTIVLKDGKVLLITGSPGGRTIINTVLCVVLNVIEFGMSPRDAVDAPRLHHQWFPDRLSYEPALQKEHAATLKQLRDLGHALDPSGRKQGDAHTIYVDPQTGRYHPIPDTRRDGHAAGY